jgi:hypothetical protein
MATTLAEGPVTRRHTPSAELVMRAMREFDGLPALHITLDQAARLLSVDRDACRDALDSLVESELLGRDRTGRYCRRHEAPEHRSWRIIPG